MNLSSSPTLLATREGRELSPNPVGSKDEHLADSLTQRERSITPRWASSQSPEGTSVLAFRPHLQAGRGSRENARESMCTVPGQRDRLR